MAGNHIAFTDKAGAVVEPPPDVVLSILDANGRENVLTIPLGSDETFENARGDVQSVMILEVNRKNIRPSHRPPYKFLITATDGSFRVVRSMDEENATRLYHNSNDEPKEVESVEIVIPNA